MRPHIKISPLVLAGTLVALVALVAAACGGGGDDTVKTVVQVANPEAQAPAGAAPSGWDTEWSVMMGVKLLQTFEPTGSELFDPAKHPLVYYASEGPGYGGLLASGVTLTRLGTWLVP